MASRKAHIVDTDLETADGVVQSLDKKVIGLAWQNEGPTTPFITFQLDGHWIITDEEKALLDKAKKNDKN